MAVVMKDRLRTLTGITPSAGAHPAPPDGDPPSGFCVMEKWAYVTDQPWTGHPENCCPTISAFLRRFNDTVDASGREEVDGWVFEHADLIAATADDGHRSARAYLAADWAVRTALPVSLRVAGIPRSAEVLQRSPEIVDTRSAQVASEIVNDLRNGLPGWSAWRSLLREKVRATLTSGSPEEARFEEIVAGATVATLDAASGAATVDAAAPAAVLGDASASGAADAVPPVIADAAAAAALGTAAQHAITLARKAPPDDPLARWTGIYGAINPPVRERLAGLYAGHWEDAGGSFHSSSLELLERMVSIGRQ